MSCNHEWGGVVIPGPVNRVVIDQCENCGELRLPDAAPPAQGIDLGPVRKLAEEIEWAAGDNNEDYRKSWAKRLRAGLALIDSKNS